MPYEQMLDFCVGKKVAALEIGTGNWSGAPHCDLEDVYKRQEDESLGESVIAEVFQQGFRIGDKVIRHAMVKVAN